MELLSGVLTVPHKLLVIRHVLLQIVEDLQFLVEGDERIQLVLKLYLLFFQSQLELVFITLIEHRRREGTGRNGFGDRGRRRCLALLPGHFGLNVAPRTLPRELTLRVAPGRTFTLRRLHRCFYHK